MNKILIYLALACLAFISCEKKADVTPTPIQNTNPSITSFSPTSGTTGTEVIITGKNLAGATDVSFGGAAASSFTVTNATTITAIIGAGASGDVKVVAPLGTSTLAGFTYTLPPKPIANSIFTLDKYNVPCNLTVNGNNPKETINIQLFSENKTVIASSSSQNLNQQITKSGFYTIEYTVKNLGGTSTKIDSIIVFENSEIPNFYNVKLQELNIKIRKSDAEKKVNQSNFLLFLYKKIARMKGQVPDWVYNNFANVTLWLDDNSIPNYTASFHPGKDWLIANGYMAEKARGIEISNFTNFISYSKEQADILLHEFAHSYHYLVMTNDFNNKLIKDAYDKSMATKKYESVAYINGGTQKHYATTNQMEYFAEITEAFFGYNDYYPFEKSQLKIFDTGAFELMEKVWVSGLKQ